MREFWNGFCRSGAPFAMGLAVTCVLIIAALENFWPTTSRSPAAAVPNPDAKAPLLWSSTLFNQQSDWIRDLERRIDVFERRADAEAANRRDTTANVMDMAERLQSLSYRVARLSEYVYGGPEPAPCSFAQECAEIVYRVDPADSADPESPADLTGTPEAAGPPEDLTARVEALEVQMTNVRAWVKAINEWASGVVQWSGHFQAEFNRHFHHVPTKTRPTVSGTPRVPLAKPATA